MPTTDTNAQVTVVQVKKRLRAWRTTSALLLIAAIVGVQAAATPLEPSQNPRLALQLREQLAQPVAQAAEHSQLDRLLAVFYQLRQFRPAWAEPAQRAALLAALDDIENDGLSSGDYALDTLRATWAQPTLPADVAQTTELLATRSLLTALSHLLNGKVDPRVLERDWNFQARNIEVRSALSAMSAAIDAGEIAALFNRARPMYPLYEQLREGLRRLRKVQSTGGWPQIADGPTLKAGDDDPRIPALRERLRLSGYGDPEMEAAADSAHFDRVLEDALRRFQRKQYLAPDGALGKSTLAALNITVAMRIDQVRANLERARWLLHETSAEFLLVDIAGYKATYFQHGQPQWSTRVQVGKPYRKTPSFRSQINRITFNPTWTVPPTILRNDILPKVRKNPGYLAANRLRVLDHNGKELRAEQIDWSNPSGLTLRQDAGAGNSLGRVAIRFDNPYSVYLHDTPHTELFDLEQRAFSSGCIRVERPLELVERLLDDPAQWNRAAIDAAIASNQTRNVSLHRPVTVLLMYWSVDIHSDGRLGFKRDIYGRDSRILAELAKPQPLRLFN
ncbi:MAG: L,D-transpeptidase family protein [Xanthomonadaceae bacterium]|nr:L,D-transpeptidase family protein [Xanthomonadaceae bacterium]MDP2185668.1 L,D-transpeptidase family protein [Xanthomonadales bacterium]MDZ4116628.1 L,D-transpeptidase family protein [Xanthomonadaceae bacterium]